MDRPIPESQSVSYGFARRNPQMDPVADWRS